MTSAKTVSDLSIPNDPSALAARFVRFQS